MPTTVADEPFSTIAKDKGFRWGAGHFGPGINQLSWVVETLFMEVVEYFTETHCSKVYPRA